MKIVCEGYICFVEKMFIQYERVVFLDLFIDQMADMADIVRKWFLSAKNVLCVCL